MAVDTTQSWQEHTSDGSTAYFSFNFNYDTTRPGTIAVGKRTADNTYSVVDASDYELIPNASGDGGQIRFIQNPSGNQVIDDIPPAGTIVRIERISVDTSSATWQIGLDMSELVNLFDRLFRLVQENKGGFDNVIKTFETQHDVSLYEMLATHDNRLFFWDNTNKTITPTDFPKEDVVRCVNGLFFRVSVNQSGIKYLEWSENGSSDWKGIDISSVNALAQDAHDIATQATNAINTHIADTNNPHSVTKAQVGLGNVDNTSDANKPISTATQTALNAKQDTISDLATIRAGASKGATAVQPGDLATVATSGSYNDLSNKPTIGDGTITIKQSGTIKGTFTTNQTGNTEIDLDAGGTGAVSSVNGQTGTVVLTASDVGAATSAQGAKADTAVQPGDLATVATSGAYSDLIGTPTIPAAQVNSDWNANSGVAQILNKPTIPTVNNSTITITQGGTTKGSFTLNQATGDTIALDAGGGGYRPDLFDWKWADHELNDVQWLRADTFSWQSGEAYEAAYDHLVDDITTTTLLPYVTLNGNNYYRTPSFDEPGQNHPYAYVYDNHSGTIDIKYSDFSTGALSETYWPSATATTGGIVANDGGQEYIPAKQYETISGVTIGYYVTSDGHKIVDAADENLVAAIYTATGVAWYYILDTTNQRFKLPRAKNFTGSVIGNGMTLGLTDGSETFGLMNSSNTTISTAGASYLYGKNVGTEYQAPQQSSNKSFGVTTDSTKSGIIAERDTTDQYKYLYFYVGNFTQEAIENTAGLNASLFNGKADTDLGNVSAGIDFVVESQLPTSGNNYTWYRKYKSGWVEQGGIVLDSESGNYTVNLPVAMADTNYDIQLTCKQDANGALAYYMNQTTTSFVREATNRVGTTAGRETKWRVEGMASN